VDFKLLILCVRTRLSVDLNFGTIRNSDGVPRARKLILYILML